MSLLELCDPDPPSVTVEASVADGIRTMLDQRVGAVGVVDRLLALGRTPGLFSEFLP